MFAKMYSQCLVQKMRRRVVCPDRTATRVIDFKFNRVALVDCAALHCDRMGKKSTVGELLGVFDNRDFVPIFQSSYDTGISNLAARRGGESSPLDSFRLDT